MYSWWIDDAISVRAKGRTGGGTVSTQEAGAEREPVGYISESSLRHMRDGYLRTWLEAHKTAVTMHGERAVALYDLASILRASEPAGFEMGEFGWDTRIRPDLADDLALAIWRDVLPGGSEDALHQVTNMIRDVMIPRSSAPQPSEGLDVLREISVRLYRIDDRLAALRAALRAVPQPQGFEMDEFGWDASIRAAREPEGRSATIEADGGAGDTGGSREPRDDEANRRHTKAGSAPHASGPVTGTSPRAALSAPAERGASLEALDTIRERLLWPITNRQISTGFPYFSPDGFERWARETIPALIAEVERLRAALRVPVVAEQVAPALLKALSDAEKTLTYYASLQSTEFAKHGIDEMAMAVHDAAQRLAAPPPVHGGVSEREEITRLMDSMEYAFGILANAYGGDWSLAHTDWQVAAAKWRDEHWHPALDRNGYSPRKLGGVSEVLIPCAICMDLVSKKDAFEVCPVCVGKHGDKEALDIIAGGVGEEPR